MPGRSEGCCWLPLRSPPCKATLTAALKAPRITTGTDLMTLDRDSNKKSNKSKLENALVGARTPASKILENHRLNWWRGFRHILHFHIRGASNAVNVRIPLASRRLLRIRLGHQHQTACLCAMRTLICNLVFRSNTLTCLH